VSDAINGGRLLFCVSAYARSCSETNSARAGALYSLLCARRHARRPFELKRTAGRCRFYAFGCSKLGIVRPIVRASMAIGTECNGVLNRVIAANGQLHRVMDFQVRRAVLCTPEGSISRACFASASSSQ